MRLPLVGPQRAALAVRVGGSCTEGRVATIDMHELAGAGGGRAALLAEVWSRHDFCEVFSCTEGALGFQFKGEQPFILTAGQSVAVSTPARLPVWRSLWHRPMISWQVTAARYHRFRNASEGGAEGGRVELTVSPAGLDSFFEAARLLGACARKGEITAEAAMAALGAVREEVGVGNMADAEVVPLAKL